MDLFWRLVLILCLSSHSYTLIDVERIREVAKSMLGRRGQNANKARYGEEGGQHEKVG